MDDHSADATAEIAKASGAVVFESPFTGLDEGRDKTWLVEQIAKDQEQGSWVLMIDGDEILEQNGEAKIRQAIAARPNARSFRMHVIYLWNDRNTIRTDGVYSHRNRPSLFRLLGNCSFKRTGFAGNLHPGCAPAACYPPESTPAANLIHLGYMAQEDRIGKWKYYNSIDPRNVAEGFDPARPEMGSYPHMVQGDVPEVPADARLKHAGPLKLETFSERAEP
jgi:hypothetical protein